MELFRKRLGIVFGLKRPTFGGILSSKGWKMTQKIEIFGQNFAQFGGFEGSCLTILSPKTHFLDIFVFFWNFRLNYLDSLIPITCALLWGPAKPYRTGLRSKLVDFKILPPYDTNFSMSYSPKERFLKEPHRGVPFVWVLSFLYLIDFKILPPPYDTNFSMSYCVGWVWCGAYLPLKFFKCLKMS